MIRNLFFAATASANNAASLEFVRPATIKQINWAISANLDAADESVVAELSTVPYFSSNTNDAIGPISTVRLLCVGVATDLAGYNGSFPVNAPIPGSGRLYLNVLFVGTLDVASISATIYTT